MSPLPNTGDRIELIAMPDDPDPVPAGTRGTVQVITHVTTRTPPAFTQVGVVWDNGRRLMLTIPPDVIRIVND